MENAVAMEQKTRKYPIGIQTFEKIIRGGYVYVDKTKYIHKMVSEGEYYFLSRPRRFGKSLLITTLQAYFEGKKELFKGLDIDQHEKDWDVYPVFHLDFSGNKYDKEGELDKVTELFLLQNERIYGKDEAEQTFGSRFQGLLKRAYAQTGKQCVILIDEYDKPLTDTIGMQDLQDENRSTLQGLYGVLKNGDANIKFAMLTGVTRYGKLGIFSASNNPRDISMSNSYSSVCGITEQELHKYFDEEIGNFAKEKNITKEELYAVLKNKYDGYHFSENSDDIYNPFSILNSLTDHQITNSWFSSGTPTYLTLMLKNCNFDTSTLEGDVTTTVEGLSSFGNGEKNVVAALYQSGYLTIKGFDGKYYTLAMPNEEVGEGLTNYLIPEYTGCAIGEFDPDIRDLGICIKNGDAEGLMQQLQYIMEQIPFESNEPKLIEANFRNMAYLMIRATGHKTWIEKPKLGGRMDIYFENDKYVFIIECKRDGSATEALQQINEKKYDHRLSREGKKLFKIGANFSTEARNLVEWKIE